jgi:ribose 5-phosphate isomerase B
MRLAISSDHAGNRLRAAIVEHLRNTADVEVTDLGPDSDASVDYPDFARPLAEAVAAGTYDRGILICGSGQGVGMTANKVPGVRAGIVAEPFSARMIVQHNDAQILCMGERVVGVGVALECVDAFLDASFEGGRHARRVGKIEPG